MKVWGRYVAGEPRGRGGCGEGVGKVSEGAGAGQVSARTGVGHVCMPKRQSPVLHIPPLFFPCLHIGQTLLPFSLLTARCFFPHLLSPPPLQDGFAPQVKQRLKGRLPSHPLCSPPLFLLLNPLLPPNPAPHPLPL